MRTNIKYMILSLLLACILVKPLYANAAGMSDPKVSAFAGRDLHLSSQEAITYNLDSGQIILVLSGQVSIIFGDDEFTSDRAVLWMEKIASDYDNRAVYRITAYLEGNISAHENADLASDSINYEVIDENRESAVWFDVSGAIFISADNMEEADPRNIEFYTQALSAMQETGIEPAAQEASLQITDTTTEDTESSTTSGADESDINLFADFSGSFNISPVEEDFLITWNIEKKIGTITKRFYLSKKLGDEDGDLLELQADTAVIFLPDDPNDELQNSINTAEIFAAGMIQGIYLAGDVLLTEGLRTIRAEEMYYDFDRNKAVINNAEYRNFDISAGIPIYIRAKRLQQLAINQFVAEDITLTNSEFYLPQTSITASKISFTDTTSAENSSKGSLDARIYDVRFKYHDNTFFYWPYIRSNLQRPDWPLKTLHAGNDNTWGTYVESNWYLARLLGLQEPEGTENTLAVDYYSKRGFGFGIESEYQRESDFGKIVGYMINDNGEDRLGRDSSRKNLEPPEGELRGRFRWLNRRFLPYDWQLTTEISYVSDRNFLESYYRKEFNIGKEQENIIYFKRIEDNWSLSFLGKIRINDFLNTLEELPTTQFNWTGQSLLEDKLTFYSENQISRFRQRYASDSTVANSQQFFTYTSTRNEIDMPLSVGKTKVVPFVAGTLAYEDGLGYYRKLDGRTDQREDEIWYAEAGVRLAPQSFWKVFPNVQSQTWDINKLRHIISPSLTAVGYTESRSVAEQRDTLNVGISQRLQTKRGPVERERTVDWMRLDMDVTWVNDSDKTSAGADRFIWNKPFIPALNRRDRNIYGIRRNSVSADYIWNISDTTAVLSDMNYDLQSGVVEQYDVGLSRMRWPNLSYYLGSRYLRHIDNNHGEKGSNAFTYALTFLLDPRYTLVYSGQFDFDYDALVRNDITLIRQYHRLFWSLTYSIDASMDRHSIAFSLWPQGIPDLAFGPSRYINLGGSSGF